MPATGVAVVMLVAIIVMQSPTAVDELPAAVTDMEILLTEDSLEMLEDLEFYSWIDFEEDTGSSGEPQNNVG